MKNSVFDIRKKIFLAAVTAGAAIMPWHAAYADTNESLDIETASESSTLDIEASTLDIVYNAFEAGGDTLEIAYNAFEAEADTHEIIYSAFEAETGTLEDEADAAETQSTIEESQTEVSEYIVETTSESSLIGSGSSFGILQEERFDNLDQEPLLNGGEVRFLANLGSSAQQLSAVFKSSDGSLLVVDGGQAADTEHLVSTIKELGGKVDAWLITHPHSDHVGALTSILSSGRDDITIDAIYYNFFEQSWYSEFDPDESGTVYKLREAFNDAGETKLNGSMGRGDEVIISDAMSFKVLNDPLSTSGIYAGNSAGLLYDINIDGKHFIILGDMSEEAGDTLMEAGILDGITCDFVQIAHHGQTGVSDAFYNALNPSYCIWPTNSYIYNAVGSSLSGLGTTKTKLCISKLKVKSNFVTLGRDVIIK